MQRVITTNAWGSRYLIGIIFIILYNTNYRLHGGYYPMAFALNASYHETTTSCNLFFSLPFYTSNENISSGAASSSSSGFKVHETMQRMEYTNLAAAIMAVDHVNERNGNVVPYLASEDFRQCQLQIPTVYIVNSLAPPPKNNSEISTSAYILQSLLNNDDINEESLEYFVEQDMMISLTTSHDDVIRKQDLTHTRSLNQSNTSVCTLIGESDSDLASLSTDYMIPYIFSSNSIASFNVNEMYPMTAQISASIEVTLKYLIDFIVDINRNYIGFFYDSESAEGQSVKESFVKVNKQSYNLVLETYGYSDTSKDSEMSSLAKRFGAFKETKFTTIVYYISEVTSILDLVYNADKYGLNGDEYVWIVIVKDISAVQLTLTTIPRLNVDAPFEKFIRGLIIVQDNGSMSSTNSFIDELQHMNETIVGPLIDVLSPNSEQGILQNKVLSGSALVYDAVIAAASRACQSHSYVEFDGFESFAGSSGNIWLDKHAGYSRHKEVTAYRVFNIRSDPISEDSRNVRKLSIVEVLTAMNGTWTDKAEIVYSDGAFTPPVKLRLVEEEMNELAPASSIVTIALSTIAISFSLYNMKRVYNNKNDINIKMVQSSYLYLTFLSSLITPACLLIRCVTEMIESDYERAMNIYCHLILPFSFCGAIFQVYILLCKAITINREIRGDCFIPYNRIFMEPMFLALVIILSALLLQMCFGTYEVSRQVLQVDEYGFPISSCWQCTMRAVEKRHNLMKIQVAALPGLLSIHIAAYGFMIFKYHDLKNFVEQLNFISAHQQHIYSQMKFIYRCLIGQLTLCILYLLFGIFRLRSLEYHKMAVYQTMRVIRYSISIGIAMSPPFVTACSLVNKKDNGIPSIIYDLNGGTNTNNEIEISSLSITSSISLDY